MTGDSLFAYQSQQPEAGRRSAFEDLKSALLNGVSAGTSRLRSFILSTDASLDGLGAVLSQVPAGEERARPTAFMSKSPIHS